MPISDKTAVIYCMCFLSECPSPDMVLLGLCFRTNSVYPTNENTAVSHYINLIIFTLPSLSACGANEILLMIHYNLTPFSITHKDACVCPDEALKSDSNFTGLNRYLCVPSLSSLMQLMWIVCDRLIMFAGTGNGHSFSTEMKFWKIRLAIWPLLNLRGLFRQMSESRNGKL